MTIPAMKLLFYLCLMVFIGCQSKTDSSLGPEQTMAAFIDDSSVYADGCELQILQATDLLSLQTNPTHYKPSARTLAAVKTMQLRIANGQPVPLLLPVTVRYRTTDKQVILHCGWVSPTVPEIDVLDVTKR
jgi:hypothetical protein